MLMSLLQQMTPAIAVLMSVYYAKYRCDRMEERHRLECERLIIELHRLQGRAPLQLPEPEVVEQPPAFVEPAPLPVARALKP